MLIDNKYTKNTFFLLLNFNYVTNVMPLFIPPMSTQLILSSVATKDCEEKELTEADRFPVKSFVILNVVPMGQVKVTGAPE